MRERLRAMKAQGERQQKRKANLAARLTKSKARAAKIAQQASGGAGGGKPKGRRAGFEGAKKNYLA